MLNRLFPARIDNGYRGHRLAIWLLVLIVFARLVIGANSILMTRLVATSADGIPLASFNPAGAQAVLSLFALLGLHLLLLALLGVVVLIRYRAMIPFMYLLLMIQQLGARTLELAHPMVSAGAGGAPTGSTFTVAILAMTLVGLVLSLLGKKYAARDDDPGAAFGKPSP